MSMRSLKTTSISGLTVSIYVPTILLVNANHVNVFNLFLPHFQVREMFILSIQYKHLK